MRTSGSRWLRVTSEPRAPDAGNVLEELGSDLLAPDDLGPVEAGERVCLVGRNGEGKSSLMRLIAGEQPQDSGRIIKQQGVKIARLDQEVSASLDGNVYSVVSGGVDGATTLLPAIISGFCGNH